MNSLKQRLLTNWHLMRIMRMAIGLWLLVFGIQAHDWASGLFSLFFIYQGVTDTGCCGAQGCYTPKRRSNNIVPQIPEDTEYEEIK